jgi:diguanylate cyclase (GGDEF)-like protein
MGHDSYVVDPDARTAAHGHEDPERHDRAADQRDRAADQRDRAADQRDRAADERDDRAEAREQAVGRFDADAASDRAAASRDRSAAVWLRGDAAEDRRAAAADRAISARARAASSIDELTGAHGRDAGVVELERETAMASRMKQPLVLAFIDVDGLKRTNDSLGHAAGDRLLRRVVDTLRAHLRSYDLIVRFGGDEFLCALVGIGTAAAAERFSVVDGELAAHEASVTVGLAELRVDESLEDLIARADAELLRKRQQRPSARVVDLTHRPEPRSTGQVLVRGES